MEDIELSLADLFRDDEELETQNEQEQTTNETETQKPDTKAVSERINTVRKQTETETKDKIAKELGFNNYSELQKANEKELLTKAGIDNDDTTALVEKLVNQRLADDPRLKKLEEYEQREKANFVKEQLNEISKLTGTQYTSIDQLSQDTLDVWSKTGNLKQAFLATQGEALLLKKQSAVQNGTLSHLANPNHSGNTTKTRGLTEDEKAIYRSVMPDITEEELSKKTVDL